MSINNAIMGIIKKNTNIMFTDHIIKLLTNASDCVCIYIFLKKDI